MKPSLPVLRVHSYRLFLNCFARLGAGARLALVGTCGGCCAQCGRRAGRRSVAVVRAVEKWATRGVWRDADVTQ
jgi:hypothetical protein